MRKDDKEKIETMLEKKSDEKLIFAHFFEGSNECLLYPSNEIDYDSNETIPFETVLDAENSEFKSIHILKSYFPFLKKVFAYYKFEDGGYRIKDKLESNGWKVINDTGKPMYETSCFFIFAVPKKFKLDFERLTEIDGIMING